MSAAPPSPAQPRNPARVALVASRFNENVSRRLLAGAEQCLADRGVPPELVDVRWVAGAWELPVMARGLLERGGYRALVALGAVIRGETAHFEIIAGESARGLMALTVQYGVPVGFGVLTCETLAQALERSGGTAGNKGYEATAAALDAAQSLPARDGDPG
ncbi:MAG TPA: 6,7-dimethyl-8-ribityllumazine synthase [Gemmatimonadales bacterium]|nr:6,7-dimethyl-8-ribityllumazine synthase [Gemmatimonadales bacterium]